MATRSTRSGLSSTLLTIAGITTFTVLPILGGAGCSGTFTAVDGGSEAQDEPDASGSGDDDGSIPVVPPPDFVDGGKGDARSDATVDADVGAGDDGSPDGDIDGGSPDATEEPPVDATPGGDVIDVAVTPDANPCNDPVDEVAGIFVSPGGAASACGSKSLPCGSVQTAITLASNTPGKSIVYLDRGTYTEAITLAPGITIHGGWNDVAGAWKRQCSGDASAIAILQAPTSVSATVRALDFTGGASLDTLTVRSKPTASLGESLYGVFVRGAGTTVTLSNVEIMVAAGGSGVAGSTGGVGTAGGNNCPNASDGANGAPGGDGAAASASTFGSDGVVGAVGGTGTTGPNGHEGTAGTAPSCQAGSSKCYEDAEFGCVPGAVPAPSCGTVGTVGCGGTGGIGGLGGSAGGSSIALYAWSAKVDVSGGILSASDGGQGGGGGNGGVGASGGTGSAGEAGGPVTTACTAGAYTTPEGQVIHTCNVKTTATGAAGGAGGRGGAGGTGGAGGGGAGGASFAFVSANGAAVSIASSTTLHHGAGGAGGTAPKAGPMGASGDHN